MQCLVSVTDCDWQSQFSTKFACDSDVDEQVHGISLCRFFNEKSYISVKYLRSDLKFAHHYRLRQVELLVVFSKKDKRSSFALTLRGAALVLSRCHIPQTNKDSPLLSVRRCRHLIAASDTCSAGRPSHELEKTVTIYFTQVCCVTQASVVISSAFFNKCSAHCGQTEGEGVTGVVSPENAKKWVTCIVQFEPLLQL